MSKILSQLASTQCKRGVRLGRAISFFMKLVHHFFWFFYLRTEQESYGHKELEKNEWFSTRDKWDPRTETLLVNQDKPQGISKSLNPIGSFYNVEIGVQNTYATCHKSCSQSRENVGLELRPLLLAKCSPLHHSGQGMLIGKSLNCTCAKGINMFKVADYRVSLRHSKDTGLNGAEKIQLPEWSALWMPSAELWTISYTQWANKEGFSAGQW